MLEHSADIREIQEYLGHAGLSTIQVHVYVTQSHLKKTYTKIHPASLQDNNVKASEVNTYLMNS